MRILIGIGANINMDLVVLETNLEENRAGCFASILKVATQRASSFQRLLHAIIYTTKVQIANENMSPRQILFLGMSNFASLALYSISGRKEDHE